MNLTDDELIRLLFAIADDDIRKMWDQAVIDYVNQNIHADCIH